MQGKDEFLGRARAEPVVRCNGSEGAPARLAWYTIEKDGGYGGDILAAFELFLVSLIRQRYLEESQMLVKILCVA